MHMQVHMTKKTKPTNAIHNKQPRPNENDCRHFLCICAEFKCFEYTASVIIKVCVRCHVWIWQCDKRTRMRRKKMKSWRKKTHNARQTVAISLGNCTHFDRPTNLPAWTYVWNAIIFQKCMQNIFHQCWPNSFRTSRMWNEIKSKRTNAHTHTYTTGQQKQRQQK